jgi:hypothetical protein
MVKMNYITIGCQAMNKNLAIIIALFWVGHLCVSISVANTGRYSHAQINTQEILTRNITHFGDSNGRVNHASPFLIHDTNHVVPVIWANKYAYSDSLQFPEKSYPTIVVAREYNKGRVLALGHDGMISGTVLIENGLKWLGRDFHNKQIIVYHNLANWFHKDKFSADTQEMLNLSGISVIQHKTMITSEILQGADILVISRAHRKISDSELDLIVKYVKDGGGLLITDLGWFWCKRGHEIADLPANRLGEVFGFSYSKYQSFNSECVFTNLRQRKPVKVKEISISKYTNQTLRKAIQLNRSAYHYVVEGKHVAYSSPYAFWGKVKYPVTFIEQLDKVYEIHSQMANGMLPGSAEKMKFVNVSQGRFNMASGYPIKVKNNRFDYIVDCLEKSNYQNPSWGLVHEMGHNFNAMFQKWYLFGVYGHNESWTNVFTLHAFDKLGISADEDIWLALAKKYSNNPDRNFNELNDDLFLLLGLLSQLQKMHGWDIYYDYFEKVGDKVKKNEFPETDQERANFIVKELSLSGKVNLYHLFKEWGFPVDPQILDSVKHFPRAKPF